MTTLGRSPVVGPSSPSRCLIDPAGVAAHGIGRGELPVLVFSGSRDALGDIAGYSTWQTARKYALPDPRLPADEDFAQRAGQCLAIWPNTANRGTGDGGAPVLSLQSLAPCAGVCFVFDDAHHPGIAALRAHNAEEFEHFVSLDRLTPAHLHEHRLRRFLAQVNNRPILLLGYGDQGRRIAATLRALLGADRASEPSLFVCDASQARAAQALADGLNIATLDDLVLEHAAVVCTPLARPAAFAPILDRAARDGRPVFDNALGWDAKPEYRPRTAALPLWLSPTADRLLDASATTLRLRGSAPRTPFTFAVVRDDLRRLGPATVPHLSHAGRVTLTHENPSFDLAQALPDEPLAHLLASRRGASVNLDGQSNYHDAALGLFAARRFLAEFFPAEVRGLLPSELRAALGSGHGVAGGGAFESLVIRSSCGRSLGAAFMTPAEQVALGVAARAGCPHGEPIIEIGSALGGSACLIAAATSDTSPPIWSIDPDAPTRPSMRMALESESASYAQRLTQIVKFSADAVGDVQALVNRHGRAGFLFIDGLHTYEAVTDDIRHYLPFLRPGGLMGLHDVNPRHAGLWRAACETIDACTDLAPVCMADSLLLFRRRAE